MQWSAEDAEWIWRMVNEEEADSPVPAEINYTDPRPSIRLGRPWNYGK